MKLKCIGCESLALILYYCAAQSPHIVDLKLFQIGLHNEPADLRARLQEEIDGTDGQGYDAIVLAYGLCGQATLGLTAREIPLVIPRAHDCITLFLGARERYREQFENHPGTYWYASDYIERKDGSGLTLSLGSGADTDIRDVYDEYVAKYGKDNADYLMEVMGAWQQHYNRAVFIDMGIGDSATVKAQARDEAVGRGWAFEHITGDMVLIRRLLYGDWDTDFLILEPGQKLIMTYDDDIVGCLK